MTSKVKPTSTGQSDWGDEWEALEPQAKGAVSVRAPVKVGMSSIGRPGGRTGGAGLPPIPARLSLIVERALLTALGGNTWRFDLRLTKDRTTIAIVHGGEFEAVDLPKPHAKMDGKGVPSPGLRIRLKHDKRFPDCRIAPVPAEHRLGEIAGRKALFVTLPRWAWDDDAKLDAELMQPAAPKAKAAPPPLASALPSARFGAAAVPRPPAGAVTAALLGDPEPDREAAAAARLAKLRSANQVPAEPDKRGAPGKMALGGRGR